MRAMTEPIPLLDIGAHQAPLEHEIRAAFDRVLASHAYILGPDVAAFEKEMAEYVGAAHAISCANGSDALVLALKALEIGPGDEVITTTFSFFATAGSVARVGATPVFADIDPESYNLDPDSVAARITDRTKAIIPVHLYGQMTPMEPIMALAKAHGLRVIEDAAQAVGSMEAGRAAGTIGDIGTLSFFPSKNLGCLGDGGMLLTNDAELADRLRSLRVHGTGKKRYHYDHIGLNSRLDTLQAAVLRVKLPHLESWSDGRRRNAARYHELLGGVSGITTPKTLPGMKHIYNQYTIRVRDRDGLEARFKSEKIGSAIYYPLPLHIQNCFAAQGGKRGDCPEAERAANEVISIPIYGELRADQLERVASIIRDHAAAS